MTEQSQTPQKKTRLKGTATIRRCVGCNKDKNRFTEFKPRWSRCAKHRIKGTKGDPACADCQKLVNGNVRQPRCIECDSKRTTKKGKKTTPPTVATPTPVAAPTPAPVVEPVTVTPITVAQTETPAAPEATQVTAPAAVEPTPTPAPEPVAAVTAPVEAKVEEPAPVVKAPKKASASKADLAKLFSLIDEPGTDTGSTDSPH